MHVVFNESNPLDWGKGVSFDFVDELEKLSLDGETPTNSASHDDQDIEKEQEDEINHDWSEASNKDEIGQDLPKDWHFKKNHPKEQIIGSISKGVSSRSKLLDLENNLTFIS